MNRILILTLACSSLATSPPPLTKRQQSRVRCVAVLALVANDQQRGAPDWSDFPWVVERGARFAERESEALARETRRSPDQIKAEIVGAIATLQSRANALADPKAELAPLARTCSARMDRLDPPPPNPSLPRCAAMVGLAQSEVQAREGNSKTAKDLSSMAAILDNKARTALLAKGKTGIEAERIIGFERDAIIAEAATNRAAGRGDSLDFEYCFRQAGKA